MQFEAKWGSVGSSNSQFQGPYGVATDGADTVYVADTGNQRIQKFTSSGVFVTKWSATDPIGIAVDSVGNVYVVEGSASRVKKFSSSGVLITSWGTLGDGDGQFDGPKGIAIDGSDNVYVADAGNNRVQKFTSLGAFITKWGGIGSEAGQFSNPRGLAVSPSGTVYVADTENDRVQLFTATGSFISQWDGLGAFNRPYGVAIAGSGTVYVLDRFNQRVREFAAAGASISDFGGYGTGIGKFVYPLGLAISSSGRIYVTDSDNYRVEKLKVTPETSITGGPAGLTSNAAPSFSFSSTESGATYECRVDSAAFASCVSGQSTGALSDGPHTFSVQAVSLAGNSDPTPAEQSFTVDTTPPETAITSGPSGLINDPTPTFTFTSSEPPPNFECRVDSEAFTNCSSPFTTSALAEGNHTFEVQAKDGAGNIDLSPASHAIEIDITAPAAPVLSGAPSSLTTSTSQDISWTGELGTTFTCSIDGGAPTTCTSPSARNSLSDGNHSLAVAAVDDAGNSAVSTATWTVDTSTPAAPSITSMPPDPTSSTSANLRFSGEVGASFECKLDNGPWSACSSPSSYSGLTPKSSHTFQVHQTDEAGHTSSDTSATWTIRDTASAALTAAPTSGLTEQSFRLDASGSTSLSGSITQYEWDLNGDGEFEAPGGAIESTSFSTAGNKTVTVQVTSQGGETDTATVRLTVRTAPPEGDVGVSIDGGAQYTNDPNVKLDLVWPGMTATARISNDGGFRAAKNLAVAPMVRWVLDSSGAERLPKTVYVRFTGTGSDTQTFQDDIILDETPPVIASAGIASLASASSTPKLRSYRIKVRASDKTSGVANAQFATDKLKKKLSQAQKYSATVIFNATSKPLWVRVQDKAGNFSTWKKLP